MITDYLLMCLLGISACLSTFTVEAIVGARPVSNRHEFPYQVSVQNNLHRHICGGGLITRLSVLTAASCLINRNNQFIITRLYVVVGTIDLHRTDPPALTIQVQKSYVPRDFNATQYRHNIALLLLADKVIHPLRPYDPLWLQWPWQRSLEHTSTGWIVGFGWNRFDMNRYPATSSSHGRLKFAISRVLTNTECQRAYPNLTIDGQFNFCARMQTRPSSLLPFGVCYGDIGSLLVNDRDERAMVIGVLSKISPRCDEKKGRGRPALYTRVSNYMQFLARTATGNNTNIEINYPL